MLPIGDSRSAPASPRRAGASGWSRLELRGILPIRPGVAHPVDSVYSGRVTKRRSATTLVLLLGLLALSLVPRGLVLCVADAHVQIEGGCELAPCDTPGEAASARFGMEPAERCTDTPLLLPSLRTSQHVLDAPLAGAAVAWPAGRLLAIPASALDARPPDQPLRSLRSVVLIV
jgi:hypothetical protein